MPRLRSPNSLSSQVSGTEVLAEPTDAVLIVESVLSGPYALLSENMEYIRGVLQPPETMCILGRTSVVVPLFTTCALAKERAHSFLFAGKGSVVPASCTLALRTTSRGIEQLNAGGCPPTPFSRKTQHHTSLADTLLTHRIQHYVLNSEHGSGHDVEGSFDIGEC